MGGGDKERWRREGRRREPRGKEEEGKEKTRKVEGTKAEKETKEGGMKGRSQWTSVQLNSPKRSRVQQSHV